MSDRIPFFKHDLGQPELDLLAEVFGGEILTTGDYVRRFEAAFSDYLGAAHTVAVTSCTGALHLSLLGLGLGPGDEVITTPMTFVATAMAILQAGARPVFVDVEPDTGNLDAGLVEAAITDRTRAIMPVHLFGLMCDMKALREIADRHDLKIVEDAAHCIEGSRDGVRPGALSEAACFSFYATKNMTSGEGGAAVTNDAGLAADMRLARLHGMTKTAADRAAEGYSHWDVPAFGWKYNMSNIEAALLLPQFERLERKAAQRQALAARYRDELTGVNGVQLQAEPPGCRHAHHLFPVWVHGIERDAMIGIFREQGVGVVVNYRAVHLTEYFARTFGYKPGDFPEAEKLGDRAISLPFYPGMPDSHVSEVSGIIRNAVD